MEKTFRIILTSFVFAICAILPFRAGAGEIFVSTTGTDDSGDGTIGNPYATIERACDFVGPGVKSCDVLIEGNTIRDVFSVGIYVDKATQTVIRNNYIYSTDPAYYRFDRPATGIGMANETSKTTSWRAEAKTMR